MSHLLIPSMQRMTYLQMMTKITYINITHHFYCKRTMKRYIQGQNMLQQNEEIVVIKISFWIYYEINKEVFNIRQHLFSSQ